MTSDQEFQMIVLSGMSLLMGRELERNTAARLEKPVQYDGNFNHLAKQWSKFVGRFGGSVERETEPTQEEK